MRLFKVATAESSTRWVNLDSLSQVIYEPNIGSTRTLELVTSSGAEVEVTDSKEIDEVALILGISLA
jgi:hypothetical protein